MNLRSKRRDDVSLDITPLIDVVFLLLIFFMVSTTFDRESEIKITLPQASEEITELKTEKIEVDIDLQGRIFINRKPLLNSQLETIREALRDASLDLESPPVIINADAEARYQLVVRVMDAARQLGLLKITFATQKISEQD
jgi:biopolymer transport protein ExbD